MKNDNRSNNFNFLRLLFATLVILSHSPELIDGNRNRELLTQIFHTISFGELAVDGFFLLSGFLIVKSWHLKPEAAPFLFNRILRIYPGYIVASVICVFVIGMFGADNLETYVANINLKWFIKGLINLTPPSANDVFNGWPYKALNGAMWTIRYEFYCYLTVLALGLLGVISNRYYWLLFSVLIAALFIYSKTAISVTLFNLQFSLESPIYRLGAFFSVGGCYYLFFEKLKLTVITISISFVFLALALFSNTYSEIVLAVVGGALLFSFANANIKHLNRFQTLPDVSYGLYLYAWPVQKMLIFYVPSISPWTVFGMATVLCIGLGWFSWTFVEKPFMNLKNQPGLLKLLSTSVKL